MKFRSVATRAAVIAALLAGLGFAAAAFVIDRVATGVVREAALETMEQAARAESARIALRFDQAIGLARQLATSVKVAADAPRPDRAATDALLRATIQAHPELLGLWTIWEPGAFDGQDARFVNRPGSDATGRYVPYWHWSGSDVVVDPNVDYETPGAGDYYLVSKGSGKESVVEPYV